ncbi:MAG: RecQ family ATP-dependent DNA helicase [Bacteroidaceae bacterium]|nr:RecQ family ATP-dependent DNA helicase [Bacteroidaceae bacterium]
MNTEDRYLATLRRVWGYDDFRGIQRDIIESIGAGRDTLGLMPTGGGKSITFQVPALVMEGTCLVVTPLIALMKDQIRHLRQRGVRAAIVYSGQSREENLIAMENCILGGYKFLYVSPERLSSDLFLEKLAHMKVSFITVDEAHCISQWGYDFRPAYLRIAEIRKVLPTAPVLALTATATPEVAQDIQQQLGFGRENVFRMSFARKNLAYCVSRADSKYLDLLRILRATTGSCIIYIRNRQHCHDVAQMLQQEGFTATYYHAGLHNAEKTQRQEDWLRDRTRIMVATNAFGMGIDKPDVRLVVHLDLPDSLEEYFQEAGRAGRDGLLAQAVMIVDGKETMVAQRRVGNSFPPKEYIVDAYAKVCDFLHVAEGDGMNVTREFNMELFCRNFHFHPVMLGGALHILTQAGYIEYRTEEASTSRLRIKATRTELYRVADERAEAIINSMLRHYGGIFVDYISLDEDLVSRETGFDMDTIYHILINLSRNGIVDYVPRRHLPTITFRMPRVKAERVSLPRATYEERRERFAFRMSAMVEYCTQHDNCRSQMLLKYFGEQTTHRCGLCDVCRQDEPEAGMPEDFVRVHAAIRARLASAPCTAYDIQVADASQTLVAQVLQYMAGEEEIEMDGLVVRLKKC